MFASSETNDSNSLDVSTNCTQTHPRCVARSSLACVDHVTLFHLQASCGRSFECAARSCRSQLVCRESNAIPPSQFNSATWLVRATAATGLGLCTICSTYCVAGANSGSYEELVRSQYAEALDVSTHRQVSTHFCETTLCRGPISVNPFHFVSLLWYFVFVLWARKKPQPTK